MKEWMVLIIAIIVHEIIHIIYDWIIHKKFPKVKLSFMSISVGKVEELTLFESTLSRLMAILGGWLVLMAFNVSGEYLLIYIIMSGIDIMSIIGTMEVTKKYKLNMRNTLIKDVPCDRCYNKKVI